LSTHPNGCALVPATGNIVDLTASERGLSDWVPWRIGDRDRITLASISISASATVAPPRVIGSAGTGNHTDGGANAFQNVTTLTAVPRGHPDRPGNTIVPSGVRHDRRRLHVDGLDRSGGERCAVRHGGHVVLRSIGAASAITMGPEVWTVSATNTASFRADRFNNGGTINRRHFRIRNDSIGPLVLGTVAGAVTNSRSDRHRNEEHQARLCRRTVTATGNHADEQFRSRGRQRRRGAAIGPSGHRRCQCESRSATESRGRRFVSWSLEETDCAASGHRRWPEVQWPRRAGVADTEIETARQRDSGRGDSAGGRA